ncbi:hypothetical protein AYO20_09471 [Fonsecaea nubica]|uniref:Uncharacterized protein n=1 Tax=Fonsecaea nubica TaxID=856822 RepID=A0A178CG80_9EURO|nr:hypothetical protein AYO20_09471 [Fonsecaea nubica]OAL28354.1 hypothetical protein AYO20_09471 [Fonsecaea nubica]
MRYSTKTLFPSDIWMIGQQKVENKKAKPQPQEFVDTARAATSNTIVMADYLIKAQKKQQKAKSESFRLLMDHLGFFHDGLSFWANQLRKKPGRIDFQGELTRLEDLRIDLRTLRRKIRIVKPGFKLWRKKWDLPTVSPIVLILDMELQAFKSAPKTLDEVESEILQCLVLGPCDEIPDQAGTGLPAIVAVCISGEQVIWGECKARWWPFCVVDSTFGEMRLGRLPDHEDALQQRTIEFQDAWGKAKGNMEKMDELVKNLEPFEHEEQLRAYHLCFDGRTSMLNRCPPCLKCSYVYRWGGEEKVEKAIQKGKFNRGKNCAEDDVHLRLVSQLAEDAQDD